MDIIEKLTEVFKEFPGIGERQAKRFVFFLMYKNSAYAENLCKLVSELKKEVAQCKECFRFFTPMSKRVETYTFPKNVGVCEICVNADSSTLMIVEKDSDLESVNKSGIYNSKYFILGGLVPIVEKNTKKRIRIEELKNKIKIANTEARPQGLLKEIILAFSISPQGNHTDQYIRAQIKDLCDKQNIKISSLGKGLSTGTELEYSDNDTLKNALKNRQ